MLKAYKYRIYPVESQKIQLANIFGSVRFVYNLGLEVKVQAWKSQRKNVNCFALIKQIVDLKEEAKWLSDVPSQALQMSLRNLDNAYTIFFRGKGFPKFKSRRDRQSFQLPQGVKINIKDGKIFIPKLKWVDCIYSRKFKGDVKTVTVSKSPAGNYFVSILVDNNIAIPKKKPVKEKTSVGIDVGIKDFAVLSDGTKIANPRYLIKELKRLRIENRKLARRFRKGKKYVEQSSGWKKQRLIVATLHERIRNLRNDFLQKLSTSIIKKFDTICLEDLNVQGMIQNKNLSKHIADAGWGYFSQMLEYKADWYGKNIIRIGRFEPSSKICSVCGVMNKDLKLSDRTWTCANGHELDRDINASINIKDFGLRTKPLLANANR